MRIAAVGDLHCRADTRRNVAVALRGVDQEADVLLLAGDLTDHGTPEEALWLAEELSQVKMERCAAIAKRDEGRKVTSIWWPMCTSSARPAPWGRWTASIPIG